MMIFFDTTVGIGNSKVGQVADTMHTDVKVEIFMETSLCKSFGLFYIYNTAKKFLMAIFKIEKLKLCRHFG